MLPFNIYIFFNITNKTPNLFNQIYNLENNAMHYGEGGPPTAFSAKATPPSELLCPQCNASQCCSAVVWIELREAPVSWNSTFVFSNSGVMSEIPAFQLGASRFDQVGSAIRVWTLSCRAVRIMHIVNTNFGRHVSLVLSLVSRLFLCWLFPCRFRHIRRRHALHFALHLSLNRLTEARITLKPKSYAARWS